MLNIQKRDFDSNQVARMWRQFLSANSSALSGVREVITESWMRCDEYGINAHSGRANFVGDDQLGALRIKNRELIAASQHSWQILSTSMIASDSIFILTDANGVLLETKGSDEIVEAAAHQGVAPGFDWSEESAGTNAVGTALYVDTPTVVRSDEHFCASAKIWDCAAALIRDPSDGKTLGILNVTSVGDLSDNQTLALAITAAKQIENTLHSSELAYSIQLLHWFRHQMSSYASKDAVLIDRKAKVITTTDSIPSDRAPEFKFLNGRPICTPESNTELTQLIEYQWPSDLPSLDVNNTWLGGIAVIKSASVERKQAPKKLSSIGQLPASFDNVLTRDTVTSNIVRRAHRMAQTGAPVLISGETGSGKELFARAIHDSSTFKTGPFVAVNCGVFTRELAASELFGYEKGAFTGAAPEGRIGKFEEADGGTLFLDEIAELPVDVQVHLLRVLQDNVVVRIGGNKEHKVNVRVIAATNRNLQHESNIGSFRTDLYFRLNVLNVPIPPLKERLGDIELLVNHHLHELQGRYGLGAKTVSSELISALKKYPWPGNIRELFALIESMYVLTDRTTMDVDDLPAEFTANSEQTTVDSATTQDRRFELRELEKRSIMDAIDESKHNLSKAATRLGISRSTLYRKIQAFNIPT